MTNEKEKAIRLIASQVATHINAVTAVDDRTPYQASTELLQWQVAIYATLAVAHGVESVPAKPRVITSGYVDFYGSRNR